MPIRHDSGQRLGGVLHDGPRQSDLGGGAGQRHGNQFRGDAGAGEFDQVLRSKLRPVERWRRTDIEDASGLFLESFVPTTVGGQQGDHGAKRRNAESSRDNWLARVPEHHQQTVPVADFAGDVVADHGRGLSGILRQHLGHLDHPCQIGGPRGVGLLGIGVEDVQAGGARIKVDVISAVVHLGVTSAVVEEEFPGHGFERVPNQRFGDASDAVLDPGSGRGEQIARSRGADFHAGRVEQGEGFVEDASNEGVVE